MDVNPGKGTHDASTDEAGKQVSIDTPVTRRQLLAGAGAAGLSLALGGSARAAVRPAALRRGAASRAGGTLVLGADAVGTDFVPPDIFQGWGHTSAEENILEALYAYPNGDVSKPVVPVLATDLPQRDPHNPRVYTVDLRQNVKFHDGTPFNAEAVAFNYMRYIDKSHPYYDQNAIYVPGYLLLGVTDVKPLGKYKVQFTTNRPLGSFVDQLVAFAGLLSPTAVRKAGAANAGLHPVGTGPFMFVEAQKGDHITLARWGGYWGQKASLDRVVVRAIPDPSAMTAALLSGDIDVSTFVNYQDLKLFRGNSNFKSAFKPSVITGYMALNAGGSGGRTVFKNVHARQAACYAIDKQKLINQALQGYANMGAGINPIPSWGYQKALRNYNAHDPNKAKALLQQAGGSNKINLYAQASGYWPAMAQSMQNDLNAVGFNTTITTLESSVFYGTMSRGVQDIFIGDATPLLFAPYIFYKLFFGKNNPLNLRVGGWDDPGFDGRVNILVGTRSRTKAKALIEKLDSTLLQQGVWQTNYYPTLASVWNKRVRGFTPTAWHLSILSNVSLTT